MKALANPVYCGIDTTDLAWSIRLIQTIAGGSGPVVGGIKLGLEFFLANGVSGVRQALPDALRASGVGFFLDLKLHDIPNTAAGGVRAVIELEPTYITVHAAGGRAMMKAAAEEARAQAAKRNLRCPKLLGVTVLTSLNRDDLMDTGVSNDPSEQVLRLAALARASGLDGAICSPHEIAALRRQCGPDFVLMVPGIRPAGASAADQKRVMTPSQAMALGATHLVVSRPICQAADPRAAAVAIARDAGVEGL